MPSARSTDIDNSEPRFISIFSRVPVLREVNDPPLAGVLLIFMLISGVALVVASSLFPDHPSVPTRIFQCAGGVLVCGGVYLTAVGIREARAERYHDRAMTALEQLGHESEAVRVGAVWMLAGMLRETSYMPRDRHTQGALAGRRRAIEEALRTLAQQHGAEPSKLVARDIVKALSSSTR